MDMKILQQKLQLCKSDISYIKTGIILFNDGDVGQLHPRSDMVLDDYDGKILPGDRMTSKFPDIFLQLRKDSRKKLNQETDLIMVRIRARWVMNNGVIPKLQQWFYIKIYLNMNK